MYLDFRLLRMTRGFRGRIALAALVGLAAVPISMLRLTLTGQTMARAFAGESFNALLGVLALIASLILLRALLQFGRDEIANATAALMKSRIRARLYDHILELGAGHFDQRRTGDAVLALIDGVEQLDPFFGQYLPQLIVAAVTPVLIFAFMAFLDLRTAFVFLIFAVLTLLAPAAFHRMNSTASQAFRRAQAATAADFLDGIQGLATLKAFGQSRKRGQELAERARHLYRSTMWVLAVNIGTGGITLLGISAGAVVALGWGAVRVQAGELPLATLLVVLLLGVEVFRPLRDLVQLFHGSMLAVAATKGMYQLLDAVPEVQPPSDPVVPLRQLQPVVRFERVVFGYDGGRRPAVSDVSFDFKPGQTLGVVGPSGAGKSTLVNLLLRFVDPQQGRILLDGHDLRELPLDTLRRQVAVVAQDTYLFYGSVAENLRVARPTATQSELEAACRAANAHEFIAELPRGYATIVGERGIRLSGGQRQRLAIARALLKNAPILVLDEALSSVDAENEATIQQALDRLQRGRTTLVIAHRLSSVATADRIIVLDRGQLVEQGTPTELLRREDGVYHRLMAAQRAAASDLTLSADGSPLDHERAAASDLRMSADGATLDGEGAATSDLRFRPDGSPTVGELPPSPRFDLSAAGGGHTHSHAPHSHSALASHTDTSVPATRVWLRLFKLVRPWWWETALVFALGPLQAGAQVALGVLSALLVIQVVTKGDLVPWLWALGITVPLAALLRWTDSWISHDLAYRLLAELRIRLYELLDPLAPAYLVRRRSGDLVSALLGDVELIELFYAHTVSPLFVAILVPGGVLIALAVLAPPLAVVLVPFLVGVALTPLLAAQQSSRLGTALRDTTGEVTAHAVDSVQGLRTVAAFDHGQVRAAEIASRSRQLGELKRAFLRWQAVQNAVIEALMGLGALAVMTAGVRLVTDGDLARTMLPLATLLAAASFQPVITIVTVAKELHQTLGAARRFFVVEDEPVPVRDGPAQLSAPAGSVGVRFEDVTFAYGRAEHPALQSVTFEVPAGRTVALVGRSGAGKTTAAHLLLRFWDPQQGRIMVRSDAVAASHTEVPPEGDATWHTEVPPGSAAPLHDGASQDRDGASRGARAADASARSDGLVPTLAGRAERSDGATTDVRELKLDDLRGLIALVAQDTYLFNTSLLENIRLGRPGATDVEILEAARAANVDEFAQALPEGYATRVGERGVQLSGGQRQRVSIARALLKNAPILVLDEATSHLDAVSEAEVRQALDRLSHGRTTLVIAHRLSTIREADEIVVLDEGRVVERGPHGDLVALDGLYSHLIASQVGAGAVARPEAHTSAAAPAD